ncbi:hypothetical protein EJB05_11179, partial [Eragrostis curvula]
MGQLNKCIPGRAGKSLRPVSVDTFISYCLKSGLSLSHGVAVAPPPRGGRPRRDQGAGGGGDGVDRISSLPDDLLLLVLSRFQSAREAARTSVLSSRWSGLWRRLPELYFSDLSPSALEAALAKVAVPKLFVLDIAVSRHTDRHSFSAADVASLLRNAARLNPVELKVVVGVEVKDRGVAVEFPCFPRATSIHLEVFYLNLTLLSQGGEFPVLERLSIRNCFINIGVLISRCPYIRVLNLSHCRGDDATIVHSTTIEELNVTNHFIGLRSVDIVAPVLKKLTLHADLHKDFTMSLLAPMVENHSWSCSWLDIDGITLEIDRTRCLCRLTLETEKSGCIVLCLDIRRSSLHSVSHERKLQEIFQFPKCSVLELYLESSEHVYGGMVLNILRICNGIRRLKLVSNYWFRDVKGCPPNCLCDQPQNWRSHNTILLGLEEVEIENFKGSNHEVDFLKLLFRCAPLTKVIVRLESMVSKSCRGCKEIYNLFKANPSVECNVYLKLESQENIERM